MNVDDLRRYLAESGLTAEVLELPQPTPTVAAAAAAVGCPPDAIGKSILFLAEDAPILVVVNGLHRLSYKRLAAYLGVSRRRLKLATAEQVLALTGYPIGGVPPLGHRRPLRTLVDRRILELETFYAGGGAINALLRIDPAALVAWTAAETVAVLDDTADPA